MRHIAFALLIALSASAEPAAGPRIARAAESQVGVTRIYDPAYVRLAYPNGDVPLERGVCSDVIIRALRAIGVDLQKAMHDDMRGNFSSYPQMWRLSGPDRNIDHRRVPNLMKYFERRGKSLPISAKYKAGDIVAWRLDNGLYHIGVVSPDGRNVVHNIGQGAQNEDVLRAWRIIGHYRW